MASTFSNLGINLQGTGDNSGTWGQLTNVNLQELDAAIAGVAPITLTGNTTLAFTSNSSSTTYTNESGRNKIVVLGGSLSATTVTVTVPNIQKDYVIVNNTGATVIISAGGSTTVTIPTTTNAYIYSNGSSSIFFALPLASATSAGGSTNQVQYNNAGVFAGSSNLTFNGTTLAMQTATALNLTTTNFIAVTSTVTTANLTTANINTANVTTLNATTATITTDNISTANINTANVTTLKVTSITIYSTITATSVVTSASLVPTGVTSGSYTAATITVGSDGRITSASSGSGGDGNGFVLQKIIEGPASGTYTANANAKGIYVMGLGGGGGGNQTSYGGAGAFGTYVENISPAQPGYAAPYAVGAYGNQGGTGGTTTWTSPLSPGTPLSLTGGVGSSGGTNGTATNSKFNLTPTNAPAFIVSPQTNPNYSGGHFLMGLPTFNGQGYGPQARLVYGAGGQSIGGSPIPAPSYQGSQGVLVIFESF